MSSPSNTTQPLSGSRRPTASASRASSADKPDPHPPLTSLLGDPRQSTTEPQSLSPAPSTLHSLAPTPAQDFETAPSSPAPTQEGQLPDQGTVAARASAHESVDFTRPSDKPQPPESKPTTPLEHIVLSDPEHYQEQGGAAPITGRLDEQREHATIPSDAEGSAPARDAAVPEFHPLDTTISHGDSTEAPTPVNPSFSGGSQTTSSVPLVSQANEESDTVADQLPPRPSTFGRGVRFVEQRPDTAEVDTDLPSRQFFSEHDGEDVFDDESEDEEDNVFAFQRPSTSRGPNNPPPFSGVNNLNNSAYQHWRYGDKATKAGGDTAMSNVAPSTAQSETRPRTAGRPRTSRQPGRLDTAQTDVTNATDMTNMTDFTNVTGITDMANMSSAGSSAEDMFSASEDDRPRRRSRRLKSADLYSDDSRSFDQMSTSAPPTRRSLGLTELSGEQTVADGRTTWGDGLGGALKEESEGGSEMPDGDGDWLNEDSPYAEVRASVSNIDDPEMPALTLRAFVIGMFLSIIVCAANTFFIFRNPAPQIPILVVQVAAFPIGRFLAWVLPIRDYQLPQWLGGRTFSLNPCPFNIKEHTIVVMMANVAITPAYATNTVVAAEKWYGRSFGAGFNILYVLVTQIIGLSMAGVCRRFVVWPASMLWPGVLVQATNLNTLHAESVRGSGSMSRIRFFSIVLIGSFFYYFIPGFLFQALSNFSFPTWIAPNNVVVNQLFGVATGLGMSILTFDWAQIAFIGSPLTTPWWAEANMAIGFVVFYWIIAPVLHYTNVWWTIYLPMSYIPAMDRFQSNYNVTRVMTPEHTLNTTAYAEYSQVYLSSAFTVTYMMGFALTSSLLTYTALYHGKRIWSTIRRIKTEADDIHMKLMRTYPEVPDWWYLITFVTFVVLAIITVEVFHTGLPVWGLLITLLMAFLYMIPTAILYAVTNTEPGFNLIAEMLPGYAFAGQPIPGMMFKTFAVQSLAQSMFFARDMKLGHYMKIPPRSMFIAQMSAAIVACLVQVGVKQWLFSTAEDICTPYQKSRLVCLSAKTLFTSSVIWGLIGPERLFSKGGIYNPQLWMLLVGALAPIPVWFFVRRRPKSWLRNANPTIMFSVCLAIPPASGINIASYTVVGFVTQFYIRRRAFAWWSKFNYVLSAALDVGTLSSVIFLFLILGLPQVDLDWWGNNVFAKTTDWLGTAFEPAPPGGFGPDTWKV